MSFHFEEHIILQFRDRALVENPPVARCTKIMGMSLYQVCSKWIQHAQYNWKFQLQNPTENKPRNTSVNT